MHRVNVPPRVLGGFNRRGISLAHSSMIFSAANSSFGPLRNRPHIFRGVCQFTEDFTALLRIVAVIETLRRSQKRHVSMKLHLAGSGRLLVF